MKKYFTFLCAALLLTSVSCQKEFAAGEGDLVDVTFNVPLEDVVGTKAVGDGTQAKELLFYAYRVLKDENEEIIKRTFLPSITVAEGSSTYNATGDVGFKFEVDADKKATVKVKLVKGQYYAFVFWAQTKDKSYYTITPDAAPADGVADPYMTVDYTGLSAQDDARDAFCNDTLILASKNMDPFSIKLRRPFAQINVATTDTDYTDAVNAGVDINATSVTLSGVADKLDFFSGECPQPENPINVTFATQPTLENESLVVYPGDPNNSKEYKCYLSMNYVLPISNLRKSLDHYINGTEYKPDLLEKFEITFYNRTTGTDGKITDEAINVIEVENVPVRPNWKTNIIGEDVLTENGQFNVIIEPGFYGEYDKQYDKDGYDSFIYKTTQP